MERKIILLGLFFCFITSSTFSQTKTETEDWIKQKLEAYAYSDEKELWHYYTITYSNCSMIIQHKVKALNITVNAIVEIPIKEISSITHEKKDNCVWVIYKMRDNASKISRKSVEQGDVIYVSEYHFILEHSFLAENLPERLKKAMNNLIKWCGGTVTEEKY
jgi:hypothetical protein